MDALKQRAMLLDAIRFIVLMYKKSLITRLDSLYWDKQGGGFLFC